jgi:hypothetical protein
MTCLAPARAAADRGPARPTRLWHASAVRPGAVGKRSRQLSAQTLDGGAVDDRMSGRVVAAGVLALGIAAAGWFAGRGFYEARASDRFVTVKGVAERAVEADIAVWPLTIVVSDNDLASAHAQLTRNVSAAHQFLGDNGIPHAQVSPQGLSVIDTQSNRFGSSTPGNRYT